MVARRKDVMIRGSVKTWLNDNLNSDISHAASYNWIDSHNGASVPGWKSRIKSHVSATGVASGVRRSFYIGGQYIDTKVRSRAFVGSPWQTDRTRREGYTVLRSDWRTFASDSSSISTTTAFSRAKLNYLADVRRTYRHFQGLTFLGELREALSMIRRPAQALRNGINSYYPVVKKRLGRRRLGTTAAWDTVRGTWLEYVFGWKPLINDIDGAMKALAYKDFQEYIPVRGYGESSSASTITDSSENYAWLRFDLTTRTLAQARLIGEVGGGPAQTIAHDPSRWGFGSWSEVIPAAWELIPYSFLVDYFTNVGEVIDAMTTCQAGIRWTNATIRATSEKTLGGCTVDQKLFKQAMGDDPDPNNFRENPTHKESRGTYLNRSVSFSRSAPDTITVGLYDLQFKCPGVGSTKWLNIAALAGLRR